MLEENCNIVYILEYNKLPKKASKWLKLMIPNFKKQNIYIFCGFKLNHFVVMYQEWNLLIN